MAGRFRFVLDDFIELRDEPMGWDDIEIVIKRDERSYGGLFTTYLSELDFWGDGYAYLSQQLNSLGDCFSTKINITYQCFGSADFETVFTGFINIRNADIDNEKCSIKVNIELDDVFASFLSQSETEVNIGAPFYFFPDGSFMSLDPDTIFYHYVWKGGHVNNDPTDNRVRAVSVANMFNFLTRAHSNDRLTIVSDFFTNVFPQTQLWLIELAGATLKSGDEITVTYKNFFGKEITKSQTFFGDEATTLALLAFKLVSQTSIPGNVPTRDIQQAQFCTEFAHATFPSRGILLETWLPFQVSSVVITGTPAIPTVSWDITQEFQVGGKGLYMTSQIEETELSDIWGIGNVKQWSPLSFASLFEEMDKHFTLGMQLEGTPGNYVLRLEPLLYYYTQPSTLRLEGIMNIKSRFESDKAFNSLKMNSRVSAGIISFGFVTEGFDGTSGSNVLAGPTQGLEAGQYIAILDTNEVYKIDIITGSTSLELTQDVVTSFTDSKILQGDYSNVKDPPSVLNGPLQAYSEKTCVGDVLDLTSEMCPDIEIHGDQTSNNFETYKRNRSGSNEQGLFCLLQCNEDLFTTKEYPYYVNNDGTIYERWAFNGMLTNHHKVYNNYIRLKNDFYTNAPENTTFEGEALLYNNTAEVRPTLIFEFEQFLSFSQMQLLINNPSGTIEVDLNRDDTYEKCWIYEVKMNVNSKKTKFLVYKNVI